MARLALTFVLTLAVLLTFAGLLGWVGVVELLLLAAVAAAITFVLSRRRIPTG